LIYEDKFLAILCIEEKKKKTLLEKIGKKGEKKEDNCKMKT
jgi:hypothetical protein